MEEYFKLSEIRKLLRVSYPTMLSYIKKGKLKAVKVGSQWRVAKSELNRFLGENNIKDNETFKITE